MPILVNYLRQFPERDALESLEKGLDFTDALHLARSARASTFANFGQRLAKRATGFGLAPSAELT